MDPINFDPFDHAAMTTILANKDLAMINNLCVEGKIKPVIDGPYPLEDVPGLIRYFGQGRHLGKVVISVG